MFDSPSDNPNVTSWLIYNPSGPKPEAKLVSHFFDFDDTDLVPMKPEPPVPCDTLVTALVDFTSIDGINYAVVNNQTYQAPKVPAMFTTLTTGKDCDSPSVYGNTTNTFIVNNLDMVWLVINNDDSGSHPCKFPPSHAVI
jgi:iron transport multicopper oxidase